MLFKILLLGFFLYILYRFIFEFLLPVYKTTQKIKQGFRDMQEKANQNMNDQQQATNGGSKDKNPNKKEMLGEYIDFEEVK